MNPAKILVFALIIMAIAPLPVMTLTAAFNYIKEKIQERKDKNQLINR
jgi:hypothetical protein